MFVKSERYQNDESCNHNWGRVPKIIFVEKVEGIKISKKVMT